MQSGNSKPEQFPGLSACTDGCGRKSIGVKAVSLPLEIRRLPVHVYTVHMSPIPEYILGTDILQGLVFQTSVGEFHLQAHAVKAVVRGYAKHAPRVLPTPQRAVTVRQYCLPGGLFGYVWEDVHTSPSVVQLVQPLYSLIKRSVT